MDNFPELTTTYYALYFVQSSLLWDWLTFLLAYTYMFLVILDNESYILKISLETSILLLFLFDTFIDFYCKSYDKFKKKNRFPIFYYCKLFLLLFMAADLIIFGFLPCYNSRPIRPFRILRACKINIIKLYLSYMIQSFVRVYLHWHQLIKISLHL